MLQLTKRGHFLLLSCIFFPILLSAQSRIIKGKILDAQSGTVLNGVKVELLENYTFSDPNGLFYLQVPFKGEEWVLTFIKEGYRIRLQSVPVVDEPEVDLGVVRLDPEENVDQFSGEDIIPTISIETEAEQSIGAQNISGLLTASRDVFVSAAAFSFGAARFNIRGYDGNNTTVMLNGSPFNDLETGFAYWSNWGGLNDVLRNRENIVGLGYNAYTFGGIGGATIIDTRASFMRKQLRVSYAISNRTYRNRIMATYSSGVMPSGWAVSLSASRRWADEGFLPGTLYDAYSYFLSVDKKLGDNHLLNFTGLGAPNQRGRSSAAIQEMYDLAGNNFYNPNWGFQNGEKRNARVRHIHQPILMLRHDWDWSDNTKLTTNLTYQFGRNGTTALDWYDARDPRPDYYRRLPSFIQNDQADEVAAILQNDINARQINWAYMYDVNRNNIVTIENANGQLGNSVTGARAQYVIEERRFDSERFNFATTLETTVNENINLSGGLIYQTQKGHVYKELDDLLGGEFYVDIDKFAEFDSTSNTAFIQNDVDNPNRIVQEGDVFGYEHEMNMRKGSAWVQSEITTPRFDFFVGLQASQQTFWRNGLVRNGKFPESSLGESEKEDFFEYGIKLGGTYKLDGRNYFILNAGHLSRAPFMRNAFISPRTRNEVVPGLKNERISSAEVGYFLRSPYAKVRLVGYFTRFEDQFFNRSFYLDNAIATEDGTRGGFVNYIMQNIDKEHLGLEFGGEINLFSGLSVSGAAALGQYIFSSRPDVTVYLDNVAEQISSEQAYLKNFYVPNTPQTAVNLALKYNSAQYWFANLSVNFFDDIWLDFNPSRRTLDAVSFVEDPEFGDQVIQPDTDLWRSIIFQEKAPFNYTVDFFGGKSWKFGDLFLYLNVGVNNILDNREFITGGYEQFRFDFDEKNVDRFPNRYFYGFGRNYFISLTFRI